MIRGLLADLGHLAVAAQYALAFYLIRRRVRRARVQAAPPAHNPEE